MTPQEFLDEINAHGFEDTDPNVKLRALNFAIKNFTQRRPFKFLEKIVTLQFNGTSAAPTTSLSDLRAVMKIIDTSSGTPRRIRFMRTDDIEESVLLTDTGTPYVYYFEGTQLKLYQIPAASQTLRARYLQWAPKVAAWTEPESAIIVPVDGHEALLYKALSRLYDLEDDPDLSARMEAHYENEFAQIQDALSMQQYDEPEYVHVVDPDDYGYSDDDYFP